MPLLGILTGSSAFFFLLQFLFSPKIDLFFRMRTKTAEDVSSSYFNDNIVLFFGTFVLALAMEVQKQKHYGKFFSFFLQSSETTVSSSEMESPQANCLEVIDFSGESTTCIVVGNYGNDLFFELLDEQYFYSFRDGEFSQQKIQ
jgi:hypothetical protein